MFLLFLFTFSSDVIPHPPHLNLTLSLPLVSPYPSKPGQSIPSPGLSHYHLIPSFQLAKYSPYHQKLPSPNTTTTILCSNKLQKFFEENLLHGQAAKESPKPKTSSVQKLA